MPPLLRLPTPQGLWPAITLRFAHQDLKAHCPRIISTLYLGFSWIQPWRCEGVRSFLIEGGAATGGCAQRALAPGYGMHPQLGLGYGPKALESAWFGFFNRHLETVASFSGTPSCPGFAAWCCVPLCCMNKVHSHFVLPFYIMLQQSRSRLVNADAHWVFSGA